MILRLCLHPLFRWQPVRHSRIPNFLLGVYIDALGEQCLASWWFTIVDDFNDAHLRNWDMIVEFVFHIVPLLESLSTEVLVVASFPRKRLSRC